ncbi:Argininosuccinate lyase 1 [compost metagenome]
MRLLVEQVEPNRARMAARAADDFSTVTDLADLLVRKADASFRDAHHIIGAVVRQALEQNLPAHAITPAMISTAAQEQLGRPVALAADDIAACLDPVRNVAARVSLGGPAPQSVRLHLREQQTILDAHQAVIDAARQRAADASEMLRRRVNALVKQESGVAAA